MGPTRREPRPHGQQRLRATEGLDLGLFIDAQHHSVGRRLQVEAHHIGDLRGSRRIRAELEGFEAVRLQSVRLPHAMHGHMRDADLLGEISRAPVGQTWRGWLQCQGDDLRRLARRDGSRSPGSRVIVQGVEAAFGEAASDAADLHRRIPRLLRDLRAGQALRHQQNRARPSDQPRWGRWQALKLLQGLAVMIRKHDGTRLIRHHSLQTEW